VENVRTPLAVVALATALALPTAAEAAIVVRKGIGGVNLGMTKAKVRAKLGAPKRIRSGGNDFGSYTVWVYPRVQITFQSGDAATAVETRSPLERTASGVGVGSTTAAVRSKIAGVKCEVGTAGNGHCFVGSFNPGARVTDFFLAKGRVTRVLVGFVID
jgi:hypothetical protein